MQGLIWSVKINTIKNEGWANRKPFKVSGSIKDGIGIINQCEEGTDLLCDTVKNQRSNCTLTGKKKVLSIVPLSITKVQSETTTYLRLHYLSYNESVCPVFIQTIYINV